MFTPNAIYYSMLELNNQTVIKAFTGLPFLSSLHLEYPQVANESLVFKACYEMLNKLKNIDGVTILRNANAVHFTFDTEAIEMEPFIIEKHDVMFNDKLIGNAVIVAEGIIYETHSTIQ